MIQETIYLNYIEVTFLTMDKCIETFQNKIKKFLSIVFGSARLIHSNIFIEIIETPIPKILYLKQIYTTINVIIISGDYRLRTTI